MFASGLLARFMQSPTQIHYNTAKRLLRYIKGTTDLGLKFEGGKEVCLEGFRDSDWAGSSEDMKSTSGFAFSLGSVIFCWSSKKQSIVAQSTAEAEYIAGSEAANHAVWLRKIMADLGFEQTKPTVIWCDNQSDVAITKNPVFYGRTKHIKIKYHVLREAEAEGLISMKHCSTQDQSADIFTKALSKPRFEDLKTMVGMISGIGKEECCNMSLGGSLSTYLCLGAQEMKSVAEETEKTEKACMKEMKMKMEPAGRCFGLSATLD
ncbi:unnamed protein product [Linum trigynum]|uniref:Uncharacterized protein n=1 Tax=Linum trigynum TaxID=586398 RepID=A0AAV2DF07_9ROSI